MIINEFTPGSYVEWAAADTEAHTYIDGKIISTDELNELGRKMPESWFREHATVHTYAWLLSDGQRFAWCESFDEFAELCAQLHLKTVWWYNAKYDFSAIDYILLTEGWTLKDKSTRKLRHKEYKSLHGVQGQRYQLTICHEYHNVNRHTYTHTTHHYDFCNIFGGGLAAILANFNVTDHDGHPIRKLEMDYQSTDVTPERISYMKNDVHGLYHAVRIADHFLREKFGRSIAKASPDVMTAGGLAKKTLLKTMYGYDDRMNRKVYQDRHYTTIKTDLWYRYRMLYRGGWTYLNASFKGELHREPLYKYDVNNMYGYVMRNMPDLCGALRMMSYAEYLTTRDVNKYVYMVEIKAVWGKPKPNMLPIWYDPITREYVERVDFVGHQFPLLMFADEWDELNEWYDLGYEISTVYAWERKTHDGYRSYIDTHYAMKTEGKRNGDKVMESFGKLCNNSAYGKLAENPYKEITHREINTDTGAVHMIMDGFTEDESCLMSIAQGALVTSTARTYLMRTVREATHNDPAHMLVYVDTDSMSILCPYDKADAYTIGAFKDETDGKPLNVWKWLAPKTYICGHADGNTIHDLDVHCKGINVKAVRDKLKTDDGWRNVDDVDAIFADNVKFLTLCGINVKGGKALIPMLKSINNTVGMIKYNDDGEYNIELEVKTNET